jgi:hypothetical protein
MTDPFPPFATSKILIGSSKNTIGITNEGKMIFNDGSLEGTTYEGGATLDQLLGGESGSVKLDDLIDASEVDPGKSYVLFRNEDNSWKAVESQHNILVVEVEISDWSNINVDGETFYQVEIPHNLSLNIPVELGVDVWDLSNNQITVHNVNQGINKSTIQSSSKIGCYVVLKKVNKCRQ